MVAEPCGLKSFDFVDLWCSVVLGVPGFGFSFGGTCGRSGVESFEGELCLVDLWPVVESLG